MGLIFKNGVKYGGYFTGAANDIIFDPRETVFSSNHVQGALKNVSDFFDNTKGVSSTPAKEAIAIVSTDDNHAVSIPSMSTANTPNISLDNQVIGSMVLSGTTENIVVKSITVGTNPTTSQFALVIKWYDGTTEQTNYIDFTN